VAENGAPRRGRWVREVWASSIGKKYIVAITGTILALYVLLHALGNLKALQGGGGEEAPIDSYAEWLRTLGEPALPRNFFLWGVRAVLIAALFLHLAAIYQLWRRNRAARPAGHRDVPRINRTLSSRTMNFTGLVVLAFIVFHILQFTTRTVQVEPIRKDEVYLNLYEVFQEWYFVLLYVVAVALLGFHLRHAMWSVFQTAGWDKPNRNATFRRFATGFALVVSVGFAVIPLAIWTGALPDPPGEVLAGAAGGSR
jgi:succinate dehydrogenase / fumarate reductase cytochrome b subunit